MVVYAVLSLTLVRMVPVGLLALIGTRLGPPTVGFIGWFGPRGPASIIVALIALEELHGDAEHAVAFVGVTVVLSVVVHGVSAKPLAARYGARTGEPAGSAHGQPSLPARGLVNRDPSEARLWLETGSTGREES